jgi:hypothetical protein
MGPKQGAKHESGRLRVASGRQTIGCVCVCLVLPVAAQAVMNTWIAAGSRITARDAYTTTVLPSGKVLVAAAFDAGCNDLASAELYDPASNASSATGSLAIAHRLHTAAVLPSTHPLRRSQDVEEFVQTNTHLDLAASLRQDACGIPFAACIDEAQPARRRNACSDSTS